MRYAAIIAAAGLLGSGCTTVQRALPGPLEAGWAGQPVCRLLHEDAALRVLRCQFAPGVGHERHYHDAHFGYTLAGGTMQITDDSGVRIVEVSSDSHFSSDGVEWHEVLNVGTTTAVFLIFEVH